MKMIIIVFIILGVLCDTVDSTTVKSEFGIIGNGSVMQYTYFKEAKVEKSAYTAGYKAGSLNYLENGEIDLYDEIDFYDGLVDDTHYKVGDDFNSTLYYKQNITFTGDKGISEFYGKGFFPNNRAISAWKKIRYDDLNYNKSYGVVHLSGLSRIAGSEDSSRVVGSYDLGDSYDASYIKVKAEVTMGPAKGRGGNNYEFEYNASVIDGVIEIRDATGWTNETGSRRIDWERDSLMRGNFSIENNLEVIGLFFPAADEEEDWLSCCIGGDIQNITKKPNDDWPNKGTYATLKPEQQLPTKKREQDCTIEYSPHNGYTANCRNLSYEDLSCTENECPGFECIFEFGMGSFNESDEENGPPGQEPGPDIWFEKYLLNGPDSDDLVQYNITVSNNGDMPAKNITVTDPLPDGMTIEGILDPISDDEAVLKDNGPYAVSWTMVQLSSHSAITFSFTAHKNSANALDNVANLTYDGGSDTAKTTEDSGEG